MTDVIVNTSGGAANAWTLYEDLTVPGAEIADLLGETPYILRAVGDPEAITTLALETPVNSSVPVVTGTGKIGSLLTTTNGTWANSPDQFEQRWTTGATVLGTGPTYTPNASNDQTDIRSEVRATNDGGLNWSDWAQATVVSITHVAPASLGNLPARTLDTGTAGEIDFASQVSGTITSIAIQSGAIAGMTLTNGVYQGTPSSTQAATATVVRFTNSGGFVDVSCTVTVAASTPLISEAYIGLSQGDSEQAIGPVTAGTILWAVDEGTATGAALTYEWFDDDVTAGTGESLDTTGLSGVFRVQITATDGTSDMAPSPNITVNAVAVPVITNVGTIQSGGNLGKIGSLHTIVGTTWTGGGTASYVWFSGANSRGSGTSYTPTEADDLTNLTCQVVVTNMSGSDNEATASLPITFEAPVSAGNLAAETIQVGETVSLDYGAQISVPGVTGLPGITWELGANAPANLAFTNGVLGGSAAAEFASILISRRARNSGGTATVQCSIDAVAATTPPVIATLATQSYTQDTGTQTYDVGALTTGSGAISFALTPRVLRSEVVDEGADIYSARTRIAGTAAVTYQWRDDAVDISGEEGETFDNSGGDAVGELTVMVTTGAHSRESAAIDLGGAAVDPVVLGTSISGENTAVASHPATHTAYSASDLVILGIGNDRQASQITPVSITAPNGETVLTPLDTTGNDLTGAEGTALTVKAFIATALKSAGTITCAVSQNNEQFVVPVAVIDAGTFDATTPISDVTFTKSSGAVSLASGAFTATNGGGVVCMIASTNLDKVISAPAGWTLRETLDVGAQGGCIATRNALTTAGESVASASFALGQTVGYAAATFVINPGP